MFTAQCIPFSSALSKINLLAVAQCVIKSPELRDVHEWPLVWAVDIFSRISDGEDDIAAVTTDTEQTDVLLKVKFVGLTFLYI